MTGFDDGRLIPIDGKTKATFNISIEIRGEAVAKDPAGFNLEASRDGMLRNFANLKRIVESVKTL
jgi:hypothetical protein